MLKIAIFILFLFIMLNIKEVRNKKKLTIAELSKLSGISKRMISAYEAGENDIPFTKLQNIASSLNVHITELIKSEYKNVLEEEREEYSSNQGISLITINDFKSRVLNSDIKYKLPRLGNADFITEIYGDEMSPSYDNGNFIVGKYSNVELYQWGKVYLLFINELNVVLRRVFPTDDENKLELKSDNTNYPSIFINKESVLQAALVIGGVKID